MKHHNMEQTEFELLYLYVLHFLSAYTLLACANISHLMLVRLSV